MIYFYSTKNKHLKATLEEAVMNGLSDEGGLFMPDSIPRMPGSFFERIEKLSFPEISYEVCRTLLHPAIPEKNLKQIVEQAINFDAPLKNVASDIYSLELFHGPSFSFKDFGARFMAQLFLFFNKYETRNTHILVATSGDTGSAIGQAFLDVPGVKVWILYPSGKISLIQQKQLTTLGSNITALEVNGTFDDCQRLVKQAFTDADLRQKLHLTSANSINIARLIPQSFYYFYAYAQLKQHGRPIGFSVPSGNFGNLTGGLLAKWMGLPVFRFIAATNVNDSVPKYLRTGIFHPHPSLATLSNAMDVGNPSNFARMLDLYSDQWESMRSDIFGVSFTDAQTKSAMQEVYEHTGYVLDPHGAVAYLGLKSYLSKNNRVTGIFLETAHPAKFANEVETIIQRPIALPETLQKVLSKEETSIPLSPSYEELRGLLLISNLSC